MKTFILTILFSFSTFADSRVVCFPGKVGTETIDRLCFDRTTLDPSMTRVVSTDEKGVSSIQIQVMGTTQVLTLYTTKTTFDKYVTQGQ